MTTTTQWQRNPGGSLVVHAVKSQVGNLVVAWCGKEMQAADQVDQKPTVNACMRCEQALAAEGKLKARGSRVKVQR